jgi:hydroxymethylbilane synthase
MIPVPDMPTHLPPTLALSSIPARSDPRDALVISPKLAQTHKTLASLPPNSLIGTSSVRRTALLKRLHPNLRVANMRGNIGTRLAKLDDPDSEFDALILAAAGLLRLGLGDRITSYLSSEEGGMMHAVGQGALGIEIREGDDRIAGLVRGIQDSRTARECLAERSLMRALEGGCSVPIGVETQWAGQGDELVLRAMVVSVDGKECIETEMKRVVPTEEDGNEFGLEVAADLVKKGADRILADIQLSRKRIEEQGNA